MTKTIQSLGLAVVFGAVAHTASATTYNLGDLIDSGASITLGDKIFGEFHFAAADFNSHDATVTPSQSGSTYYLTFQGPWVVANGAAADISLQYTVETSSGHPLITMIDQAYVLSASGTGMILIGETVRTGGFAGTTVAQSSLSYLPPDSDLEDPAGEAIEGDNLIIDPPQSKLWVTKDVFFAADDNSIVGPTTIVQSFHQIGVADGGTTVMMLGLALSGVGLLRRRVTA